MMIDVEGHLERSSLYFRVEELGLHGRATHQIGEPACCMRDKCWSYFRLLIGWGRGRRLRAEGDPDTQCALEGIRFQDCYGSKVPETGIQKASPGPMPGQDNIVGRVSDFMFKDCSLWRS